MTIEMFDLDNIPDHPIVRNMENTGYPNGVYPKTYICPRCGEECEEYYIDDNDNVVGCENCITMYYAEDWDEEKCD